MSNGQRQVSPQERAALFSQMTRQHWKQDGTIGGAENGTTKFSLNKVRMTSRVRAEVSFDLTVVHASNTTYVPHDFAPFTAIRRAAVEMNNGFNPFIVGGQDLLAYSFIRDNAGVLQPARTVGRAKVQQPLVAASGAGAINKVRFLLDLPMSLNDRDPVSLIITQNQQTNVTVSLDFATGAALIAPGATGYTATISNIAVTPLQESFSVPPVPEARPDIGILKLVQSTSQPITGAGNVTVKLPTGMTYRKIAILITDSTGAGLLDTNIQGNFEIVMNQSDIPYTIKPSTLAAINHEQFGVPLPNGLYAFDFSYQGIANYGGLRDYVDTENLTEFWFRFNAPGAGNITIVYEELAKLLQQY